MKTCISLLLFLLFANPFQAQKTTEEIRTTYDTATIRQWGTNKFILNNKKLKKKELRVLLLSFPESAESYHAYKKKNRVATALWVSGAIAYLSGFFVIGENDVAAGSLVIGGAVVTLASIPFTLKAQNQLSQSVWLYNRAVLTRKVQGT
jgi:hypothetical protein